MCHPPVGLNLYVASGITKMGITELTVAVWPWLLTMLVFLVLVTYWPPLSTWLPQHARHDHRGALGGQARASLIWDKRSFPAIRCLLCEVKNLFRPSPTLDARPTEGLRC